MKNNLFFNNLNLLFFIMKKTFFYLFSVLCFMAVMFTSCERPDDKPQENEYPVPAGAVGLKALTSEYNLAANMQISGATHSFLLMFATEECEVIEGTPFGNGRVLVMDLFSETAENLLPQEGIYKIGDGIEDGAIVAGFDGMGMPIGTYVYNMVDGEFVDYDFILSGAVEIKKGKAADELEFYIYAVFEDGSEANYYYGGKLLLTDLSAMM